jgi:hypothetical protein
LGNLRFPLLFSFFLLQESIYPFLSISVQLKGVALHFFQPTLFPFVILSGG